MDQSSLRRPERTPGAHRDDQALFDDEYNDVWPSRMPSSTRRYHGDVKTETGHIPADVQSNSQHDVYASRKKAIPPRRTAVYQATGTQPTLTRRRAVDTEEIATRESGDLAGYDPVGKRRFHWLVYLGLALCVMLIGWIVFSALSNWWQTTLDDWHYGRPRTYQVDMVVGHGDSPAHPSHFIALNLNRHVQIIEFPGGDSTKVKIYLGPTLVGSGQDLAPVTLTFKDVNGDGKLDMIVNVQDSHFIFINDGEEFRLPRASDTIQYSPG